MEHSLHASRCSRLEIETSLFVLGCTVTARGQTLRRGHLSEFFAEGFGALGLGVVGAGLVVEVALAADYLCHPRHLRS